MLQSLASDWTRMAKNDIRKKVIDFMKEVDTTTEELAYALAISEGEMHQILEGNGEISLSTFAKLLIATGNALEIKPIEETPIRDYHNMPHERFGMPRPRSDANEREPRNVCRNVHIDDAMPFFPHFGAPSFSRPINRPTPNVEERHEDVEESVMHQPRDPQTGRFRPWPNTDNSNQRPRSKFATMTRPKLVEIIKNNLWDSEIDTFGATFVELVKFLENKDAKIKEMRERREMDADPTVSAFKKRVQENLEKNPHLREYLKSILGE
jgi:hypothetical protein